MVELSVRFGRTIDCCHDKPDLHCICCAGKMGINLLGLMLIERHEPVEDVVASCRIVGATYDNV
jgi:hypothetical protein